MTSMNEIDNLVSFHIEDIGSILWFENQQRIINLHQLIVSEMQHGDLSPTATLIHHNEKTETIFHEIICLSIWKRNVLRSIKQKNTLLQVFPIYSILFHESVCCSVLLAVMFCHEKDIVDMFEEDVLVELIDHCVEHIIDLIALSNKKEPLNLEKNMDADTSNTDRIETFEKDLLYQVCNIMLSILRLVVDHIGDLQIGIVTRLLHHHDVPILLTHLVENQAWTNEDTEGNLMKYNDVWTRVGNEDKFLLGKYDSQTWKMLLDLLMHPKCSSLYEISTSRQSQLLKLEKHLHEILIDQFPALANFRRWFAQLKMTKGRDVLNKPLIMELETKSVGNKYRDTVWDEIVNKQLEMFNNIEVLKEIANKNQNIYLKFEELYDGNKNSNQKHSNIVHFCEQCKNKAVFKCSRCKSVWYCNKTCQIKHWSEHKKYCCSKN